MSKPKKDKLKNVFENYSGKIGGIVFQKNGHVRVQASDLVKRKKKKS